MRLSFSWKKKQLVHPFVLLDLFDRFSIVSTLIIGKFNVFSFFELIGSYQAIIQIWFVTIELLTADKLNRYPPIVFVCISKYFFASFPRIKLTNTVINSMHKIVSCVAFKKQFCHNYCLCKKIPIESFRLWCLSK